MDTVLAYGRVSTPGQARKEEFRQRKNIATDLGVDPDAIDFVMDTGNGSLPLAERRYFTKQLKKAQQANKILWVDDPDRLVKSYDPAVIEPAYNLIQASGVRIKPCCDVGWVHDDLRAAFTADRDGDWKLRRLVRIVDRYLRHRHLRLSSRKPDVPLPALKPYRNLVDHSEFPILRKCARYLLDLEGEPSRSRRRFFAHCYLGAAYDRMVTHRLNKGARKAFRSGQRSWGERPGDQDIFAVVRQCSTKTTYTRDGRPRHLNGGDIAQRLNRRHLCNTRGRPFTAKTVRALMKCAAYRRFASGTKIVLPKLPTFRAPK